MVASGYRMGTTGAIGGKVDVIDMNVEGFSES